MDQDFSYFYHKENFGPALETRQVPEESLEKYRNHLPDQLLQYWRDYGWSGYGNGLFWTINPDEYAPVVATWLEGTPFDGMDNYHAIALSAFGKLFLWGEKTGPSLSINAIWGMISPNDDSKRVSEGKSDFLIRTFFSNKEKDQLDQTDEDEHPLFDRAVKQLGILRPGEMYGLFPALALGGSCELEHLKKTDAVTHLTMLAQLGEKQILRDIVADLSASGLLEQIAAYRPKP